MDKQKKYGALISCLVLAVALGAGIAGSRSAQKEAERLKAENEAALLQAENEAQEAQRVDVNKNANPDGIRYNNTDENGSPQEYFENTNSKSNDSADDLEKEENGGAANENKTDNSGSDKAKTSAVSLEDMDGEEFVLADTPDAKPVFSWPLDGDIVMDFSSEALVYDATLEQYRTNDTICISAVKGTPVRSAADGTVESVAYDDEEGYTVTVFHGNGWRTTYGQLDENTAVEQGDIVRAGDILGTVSSPTKYSLALGEHLSFAVLEDSTAIDPKVALAQ